MAARTLKLPVRMYGPLVAEERALAINEKERTVELSFSSEIPAKRWFGQEILDHADGSVNLKRMNNGGALLLNHDTDEQIGVVVKAEISPDRKGRATVRFGKSARAEEIWNDVKDGIRRLVSVGYRINKMVREKVEGELETFRAIAWEPLEISIVPVPIDDTVGVGRGENKEQTFDLEIEDDMKIRTLLAPAATDGGGGVATVAAPAQAAVPATVTVNVETIRSEALTIERKRVDDICEIAHRMAKHNPNLMPEAQRFIKEGKTVQDFQARALALISNTDEALETPETESTTQGRIGMSPKDVARFSVLNAIRSVLTTGSVQGFEKDVTQQCNKRYGRDARSFWIPGDVLNDPGFAKRDLLVGTGSLGGNLVAAELHSERFIDLLRNRMLVAALGATLLPGLNGNFIIPRQNASTTAYWTTETQSTTESNLTIDQITLTPKGVTALQDYSKNIILQSAIGIEALIRNDVTAVLARAIDLAAIHGTGSSGQPTGIINVSGIGDVTGGANGAAAAWANIVDLETKVATANADLGALGYLTNAKQRGKLKSVFTNATYGEIPVWQTVPGDILFGTMNGYRAGVSNQVSSALTKGTSTTVCSAIFFGNWADLYIGQWGNGIDILIDPYTLAAQRLFRLYADAFVDLNVRHPESFAAMKDAL